MKLAKSACWVLSGLLLTMGMAQAQEAGKQGSGKAKPAAKKSAPAAKTPVIQKADAAQARAEAEAKAMRDAEVAARAKLLLDADMLIKSGKAAEAYALLEPQQSQRAGDPDYDYLLGIAALDSGKPNEAIFALERVLAVSPNHLQARAEIARAYFAVGEKVTAKQEFEAVQSRNPPEAVNATIQRFLDAIAQGESAEKTMVRAYLEATLGNDSNVNSATGSSQVAIPAFGGAIFTLNNSGVEQSDVFASLSGAANVRQVLSHEWAAFGGVSFSRRMNSAQDTFDTGNFDGNAGVSLTRDNDNFSAALQAQSFEVDNQRFREALGMTLQWQSNLGNNSQTSAYFQYTDLHYPASTVRDADRYVLGAAYARALGGEYQTVVYAGAYVGEEREQASGVPHLGHDLYGVRAGGEMKLDSETRLFGSASAENRSYGGDEPLFLVSRDDTQIDLKAGVSYIFAKRWTVTPQISYTTNDSNIVINDYDRTVISVGVRRDFN